VSVQVFPTGCDVGAEIKGVDLAKPLPTADVAKIVRAFIDHQVIFIRGQELSARQFADFSAQFGRLRPHIQKAFQHADVPEIVYNRNVDENGNFDEAGAKRGVTENLREGWHSDLGYEQFPAKATAVHALEVPSSGGNTCFASGYRAFDEMPDALRQRVMHLKAEFALGRNRRNQQTQALTQKLSPEDKLAASVVHPVICRNPDTNRLAIYANPLVTVRILDVDEDESDDILERLLDQIHNAGTSDGHWEHQWQVGDTIMWENRGGLLHSGRLDYPLAERRVMYRTTIGHNAIEAASAA
jgi:taurine dioxygenase